MKNESKTTLENIKSLGNTYMQKLLVLIEDCKR